MIWQVDLFKQLRLEPAERARLLSGTPRRSPENPGQIVCACFSIGINMIVKAVEEQGLYTLEAIGKALGAGTNCRSCVSELRRSIKRVRTDDVA